MTPQIFSSILLVTFFVSIQMVKRVLVSRITRALSSQYLEYLRSCRSQASARDFYYKYLGQILGANSDPTKPEVLNLLGHHGNYLTQGFNASDNYEAMRNFIQKSWFRSRLWRQVRLKLLNELRTSDTTPRFNYYHLRTHDDQWKLFEHFLEADISGLLDYETAIHQEKAFADCGNERYPAVPRFQKS